MTGRARAGAVRPDMRRSTPETDRIGVSLPNLGATRPGRGRSRLVVALSATCVLAIACTPRSDASPLAPIYKRLMTVTDSLWIREESDYRIFGMPPRPACPNTYLLGQVRSGAGLQAMLPCFPTISDFQYDNGLAEPDVESFIAQKRAGNPAVPLLPDPSGKVDLVLAGAAAAP